MYTSSDEEDEESDCELHDNKKPVLPANKVYGARPRKVSAPCTMLFSTQQKPTKQRGQP